LIQIRFTTGDFCHISVADQGVEGEVAFGSKFVKFKDNCDKFISQFLIAEMEPAY